MHICKHTQLHMVLLFHAQAPAFRKQLALPLFLYGAALQGLTCTTGWPPVGAFTAPLLPSVS